MRTFKGWLVLVLLATPVAAIEQAGTHPADSDRQAIIAQLDAIYRLSVAKGTVDELTERQLAFFTALPTIIGPGQAPIVGRESVENFYRGIFGSIEIIENSYELRDVRIDGDTAVRQYVGTGKFRMLGQEATAEGRSLMTDVLLREDGTWKTHVHSWLPLDEPEP